MKKAEEIIRRLKDFSAKKYVNPYDVALIYIGLGSVDQAFEWLEAAFGDRSDMLVYLNVDPRLDPIRSDSRFLELTRRVGIHS
jgi:hypothetical protein